VRCVACVDAEGSSKMRSCKDDTPFSGESAHAALTAMKSTLYSTLFDEIRYNVTMFLT
jgi:hypothetical protein